MALPSAAAFDELVWRMAELKYGGTPGATARLHRRLGYRSPDLFFEAMATALIERHTIWLDAGCGRFLFPSNPAAARAAAASCGLLVGVDPSENIHLNRSVHVAVLASIEDYATDRLFDLVTLRMVAEHVERPDAVMAALKRLVRPGGWLLIYTVDSRSPSTLLNRMLPRVLRQAVMRRFGGRAGDVFPAYYRMNRRPVLRRLAAAHGFREAWFMRLDDCRATLPFGVLHALELRCRRTLRRLGLPYPEACLLAVLRRSES